jgi:hypothetical protein
MVASDFDFATAVHPVRCKIGCPTFCHHCTGSRGLTREPSGLKSATRPAGGAPPTREWRAGDRLRTGDPFAMATDAMNAYLADRRGGKDALLVYGHLG